MTPAEQADAEHEPELWLIRHGETEWSRDGRHTGRTDLPLTPEGEQAARALAPRLDGVPFDLVLASPLTRARHTAELAGLDAPARPQGQPAGSRPAGRAAGSGMGLRRVRGHHHRPDPGAAPRMVGLDRPD